jgi:hypothetical protein
MSPKTGLFLSLLFGLAAQTPALGLGRCAVGDICVLTFPLFGCKDPDRLKPWVELYVDQSPEAAENYLTEEENAGRCARFNVGDHLRIVRYIGLSRIEATRAGETERYTVLLK